MRLTRALCQTASSAPGKMYKATTGVVGLPVNPNARKDALELQHRLWYAVQDMPEVGLARRRTFTHALSHRPRHSNTTHYNTTHHNTLQHMVRNSSFCTERGLPPGD